MKITPLKQCDPKWGNKKIPPTNLTLCGYGCLITGCAMVAGTTPDVVADKARFTNQGLIIWESLTAVGLKLIKRERNRYENNQVLGAIKKYGFCLVEVLHPSGFLHWVVFIGNQKMIDPLTGKEEATSKYPLVSYCILESLQINQEESMPNLSDEIIGKSAQRDRVVNEYCLEIGPSKDDELYNALEKMIDEDYLKKSVVQEKIKNAKKDVEQKCEIQLRQANLQAEKKYQEALLEIREQLENYGGETTLSGLKNSIAQRETERKALKEQVRELTEKPENPGEYSFEETGKEFLRWVVIGFIPAVLLYLQTINAEWAIGLTLVVRLIDKAIHNYGKATDKEWLIQGVTRF